MNWIFSHRSHLNLLHTYIHTHTHSFRRYLFESQPWRRISRHVFAVFLSLSRKMLEWRDNTMRSSMSFNHGLIRFYVITSRKLIWVRHEKLCNGKYTQFCLGNVNGNRSLGKLRINKRNTLTRPLCRAPFRYHSEESRSPLVRMPTL